MRILEVSETRGIGDVVKTTLSRVGEKYATGASSSTPINKTAIAQFPAERNSANDSNNDYNVNDLYKNGLLFTAFNYTGRTTGSLRSFRKEQNKRADYKQTPTKDAVVNILMPRGMTDIDQINHRFNNVGDSIVSRGGGTVSGAISTVASHALFGALESVTQGVMADYGEQIYVAARSMYAGAENRIKTFTWELVPQNVYDLIEIVKIYELFSYYSYGHIGTSGFAKQIKTALDEWYKSTFINRLDDKRDPNNKDLMFENVTSFLSNVNVVTNPVIWTIKNFGKTSSFDGRADVFGPAQIQSIRFDKTPDATFNGLAIAPNLPSSFTLEVTFREILTLTQADLYSE